MKKAVVVLICLFLGVPAFPQVRQGELPPLSLMPFKPEWAFGFNGGVVLSKISFNPIVKQDMLLQYTGGFTARYISEKNIGLQLELNYSLRGWKERTDSLELSSNLVTQKPVFGESSMVYTNYSRSLAYIELPFMTHIYFNMGKRARVFFLMGPQIGCYLNEKVLNLETVVSYSEESTPNHGAKVQRTFDYGLLGGMGLEFRTGIGRFMIDGRYYYGLSDIFSNKKSDYFQSSSNQVISIKGAYLFRLKN